MACAGGQWMAIVWFVRCEQHSAFRIRAQGPNGINRHIPAMMKLNSGRDSNGVLTQQTAVRASSRVLHRGTRSPPVNDLRPPTNALEAQSTLSSSRLPFHSHKARPSHGAAALPCCKFLGARTVHCGGCVMRSQHT